MQILIDSARPVKEEGIVNTGKSESDFIDRLYAVAMEPERFTELVEIWNVRLNQAASHAGSDYLEQIANLESHLQRAEAMLTLVTSNEELLPTPLHEKLQSEPYAMLAIDEGGIVCDYNESAKNLYDVTDNQPVSDLPFDPDTIDSVLVEIRKLNRDQNTCALPQLIRATRIDNDNPVIISFGIWRTAGGRNLLLLKTIDFTWPEKLTPLVQNAFTLTDAETAVMQFLAEGHNPSEISALREASIATIRTQVRSIYAKTATRNQSEFMRMALGLTTLELLDSHSVTGAFKMPPNEAQPPYPRLDNRFILTLPDGRHLDYSIFGAPEGRPCLFMHSEFFGDGWPSRMVQQAIRRNLKIIAPIRPHNGRSSPYPKNVKTFDQVAHDTAYLLDRLNIEKIVLLSQVMAPSLFALMFSHHYPERLKGIIFLATLFPFGSEDEKKSLHFFHRFLSDILYRSPRMLKFIAQAGMAYHNRVGTRRFFQTFAEKRPADVKVLQDDVAFAAMAHGAVICGTRGHEGYYNDYRCIPDNIESKFMGVDCPVTAVIGDTMPHKSISNLLRLVDKKRNYKMVPAPGGGQYIMYSHQDLIVDCIADHWITDTEL